MNMQPVFHSLSQVESVIQSMLGPDCAVVASAPDAYSQGLLTGESAAIERAVPKRRSEYITGRVNARSAMAALGIEPCEILQNTDRAPIWPKGIVGSISHSNALCVAAVACDTQFQSLGIDVEITEPLDLDLVDAICTDADRAWINSLPPAQVGLNAKLIFSAKEAAYKCQYPSSKTVLEFHDLDLFVNSETAILTAQFRRDVANFPAGTRLYGKFAILADHIITTFSLTPKGAAK